MLGRLLEQRSLQGVPWINDGRIPSPLDDGVSFTSPVRIAETAALRVAAVWACVRVIADAVASAPIDVYSKQGAIRTPLTTPAVLADPMPGVMSPYDWRFAFTAAVVLAGNGYAFKADLDPMGYPRSLTLFDPTQVTPKIVGGRIVNYSYGGEDYPPERILHVRAFTLPGRPLGVSPLEQFGQTIGMAAEAERFAYQFFTKGGVPEGILYSTEDVDKKQAETIKRRIRRSWRRGEVAVVSAKLKYERVADSLEDAQFIESQLFTISEICRIFGVRPSKIGHAVHGTNVTYANIETDQIAHLIDTVYPWASRLEGALSTVLPRPQFAKFNLDAQVRVDLLTRYKSHGMSMRDGWGNADERRALEDLEPLPDGQGKTYLWPLTAAPTPEPAPTAAPGGNG